MMSVPFGRLAVTFGSLLFLCAVALVGWSFFSHESPLKVLVKPVIPSPQRVFGKDHLLVLVIGLDYDYDARDVESSKTSRSDIIKAINLDFQANRAYVLSVPRDMDAVLPSGQEAKLNQAQSEGGIAESQTVIAKWLGIPKFDRYVILRIDTMKDLINALGGVNVVVMNSDALRRQGANGPIAYDDSWGHLHVRLQPGLQHLNGDQAVGYARFRHDWCSDPCRIMRQDQVVKAIAVRLTGDKLNTLGRIAQLLGVMRRDVETSLTFREQLSIANAFLNSPSRIVTAQVPYVADKDIPTYGNVIIPDTAARDHLVQSMLIAPPREPATVGAGAGRKTRIRVDVLNGTSSAGLAKRIAASLKAKGFIIGNVGNSATTNLEKSEFHSTDPSAASQVRDALGMVVSNAPIVTDGTPNVRVLIGRDLSSTIDGGAPQQ